MKRCLKAWLAVCLALSILFVHAAGERNTIMPRVSFYITHYIGHVGREVRVMVECRNSGACSGSGKVFDLRGAGGQVLASAAWQNLGKRLTFVVRVDETMLGGHDLSVWLGDEQVSIDAGYAAFSDLSVPRVTRLNPTEPALALTIVCGGGSSAQVDEILSVLEKHQVKATFFLNGGYLTANPEDAKRMLQAGHEIGSHGNLHIHMADLNDVLAIRSNITAMNRKCEEILGIRPRLFRAPFSETNEKVTAVCRAEGMEDVQWSIDSKDWSEEFRADASGLLARVKGPEVGPGVVIQFHLNGFHTAEVLDTVIPYYQNACGLRVVTVGELMQLSGREFPPMPQSE